MYIALLGRQPELSIAELERLYGDVRWFSPTSALIETRHKVDIQRLGGSQKIGRVIEQLPTTDWRRISEAIVRYYSQTWRTHEGKITLGLSAYGVTISPRELQKVGLTLKSKLKQSGVSLRLIPNQEIALSTATSHHNKLGLADNKIELLIIRGKEKTIIAESTGAQNITALAGRDQGRPRRDAFVGMLPPKLAQIMINLAAGPEGTRLLDPFCGTGVLLQEALLMGYDAYGTDLSEKMIRYTTDNLTWLEGKYPIKTTWKVHEGDAMTTTWEKPLDAVVCETYLGQPFSAPPSPAKLTEVRGNCNHIIGSFLENLSKQLAPGTPVVLAVPAWKNKEGTFTHLPLIQSLETYGFRFVELATVRNDQLLYFRPDQVVARELLVLIKK
ncbi:MAG TPA: DNA methyltransferase [Dongiaceae bacterium]|nr:DNA methyltransferase [Dongiaceae bacterium]